MKTCYQYMLELNEVCQFQTNEGSKVGKASNSEIKRWLKSSSIEINFERVQPEEELPDVIKSVVLFPKSKQKRCTLFFDNSITLIQINENLYEQTTQMG